MKTKHLIIALLIGATLVLSACANLVQSPVSAASDEAQSAKRQAPLQFMNHVQMGMTEQDVYVEIEGGMVRRIHAEEAAAFGDAPLYTTAVAVPHDPFGLDPSLNDPFAKGEAMGVTMDEWLAASGSGTYTVFGEQTELELTFDNLVPNGVYTLWCATISVPPAYRIVDIACGNPYGTDNTVIADAQGHAHVRLMTTTMPDATDTYLPAVAMAYHSDGMTYGEYPGDFGLNSHVQILAFVPAPADAAWQVVD